MPKFAFDLSKHKMPANIYFLRLKNFDDIIAYVIGKSEGEIGKTFDDSSIYVASVARICYDNVPSPTPSAGYTVTLREWIPCKVSPDEAFEIWVDDIMTIGDISDGMKEYYLQFCKIIDRVKVHIKGADAVLTANTPSAAMDHNDPDVFTNPNYTEEEIMEKTYSSNYVIPENKKRWAN